MFPRLPARLLPMFFSLRDSLQNHHVKSLFWNFLRNATYSDWAWGIAVSWFILLPECPDHQLPVSRLIMSIKHHLEFFSAIFFFWRVHTPKVPPGLGLPLLSFNHSQSLALGSWNSAWSNLFFDPYMFCEILMIILWDPINVNIWHAYIHGSLW